MRTVIKRTVRDDDPELSRLLAAGWVVVAESWGARLHLGEPPDLARARAAVDAARARGYDVRELLPGEDPAVLAQVADLEAATAADYPSSPATDVLARTHDEIARLVGAGSRFFGARGAGRLLAVTAIRRTPERAETDFTSVRAEARRRGLAVAVKGASVIAMAGEGVRVLGTGGAAVNAGSLAMNAHLGYVVTERWLSLHPPVAPPEWDAPHRR
jgi:hypothetical protein